MSLTPLKPLRRGQAITEGWINELASRVNLLLNLSVDPATLNLTKSPSGMHLSANSWRQVLRFELTASLSVGGSAAAKTVRWDGTAYVATSETLTVYDSIAAFTGSIGQQGWCVYMLDSGRWEVMQIEC